MFTNKRLIYTFLLFLVAFTSLSALEDNRISLKLVHSLEGILLYSANKNNSTISIVVQRSPTWASQNSTFYKYGSDWKIISSIEIPSISSTIVSQNSLFYFFTQESKNLRFVSVNEDFEFSSFQIDDSTSNRLQKGVFSIVVSLDSKIYFQMGTSVFSIHNDTIVLHSNDVSRIVFNELFNTFVLIKQTVNATIVEVRDTNYILLKQEIIDKKEFQEVHCFEKGVILTSEVGNYNQLISLSNKNLRASTIEATSNLLAFNKNNAFYIDKKSNGFNIVSMNLLDNFQKKIVATINDPLLFEPENLSATEKYLYVLFRNGVIIYNHNGEVLSKEYFQFGNFFDSPIQLLDDKSNIFLSNENSTLVFKKVPNNLWWFYKIFYSIGQYFLSIVIIVVFIFGVRKYLQKTKILKTLLGLQTVGVVFVIDGLGRLTLLNDLSRVLLKIPQFEGLGRLYYYYFENQELKHFREFIEKSFTVREPISQEIIIESEEVDREFLISSTPIQSSTGRFSGVLITAVEITEQLESKRLENWAHLAHDMQTNLSIVKLNAENFESVLDPDLERKRKIIFQTKLLMQRIRDLVTVGKSSTLELDSIMLAVMLQGVFNEFDPVMYPSVTFILKSNEFSMVCDSKKLSRAIRNAVENAIRSLQGNPGIVELSAWKETGTTFISINDTGVGMDVATQKNMLKPYFTTSKKYGGTGIGSIIMQKVLALHKAEISVESVIGVGTKIVFKIPEIISQRHRNK